ncbi:MAG: T9SS type A sorting domain-containing protein [Bacteroidales bacterium]|nr:T9SS type A sorting domain-containing protein [Bacteroidales bacterium]
MAIRIFVLKTFNIKHNYFYISSRYLETTFDISQLSKGVYILNVKVPNNVLNYKIIKQ